MRNPVSFIPSLFTILNLFCGFLSIVNASNGDLTQSCMFIIYAALFDAFDGVLARFTGSSSRLGVELDSLSDLVSFGAAPSFILYKFHFIDQAAIGIAVSSLLLIFGAVRLARFNANLVGFEKNYFTGVPVPISAITITSFFLFYYNNYFNQETSSIIVLILALILPALNVSKFRYDTTPKFTLRALNEQPLKFIVSAIAIIFVIVTKGYGLFIFCIFYLSTGFFRSILNQLRKKFFRKRITDKTGNISVPIL